MPNFFQQITGLLRDPAPDFVFEITEAGIAWARPSLGLPPSFEPLEPGILVVSPLTDNVLKPDALADVIRRITNTAVGRRKGSAVVILPDFCSRVTVLSFDKFPTDPAEQLSLVRFRMKKSVPFDVDSAVVSYHAQPSSGKNNKVDVVVALAALEIVARYEAAFRAAGLHPGCVTTASLAMADLTVTQGITLLSRLAGRHLSVLVISGSTIKLARTVELLDVSADEVLSVLFPTLAYIEDELGSVANRLNLIGFEQAGRIPDWVSELQIPVEPLGPRFGAPTGLNAGVLGYLESIKAGGSKAA